MSFTTYRLWHYINKKHQFLPSRQADRQLTLQSYRSYEL